MAEMLSRSAAEPAYVRTTEALRELALSCPWNEDGVMPAEGRLMGLFGVSRGTLRRAAEELVREGLLRPSRGRGTFVNRRAQVRATVREALRGVALPDSRWHLDVDEFVPDFEGSDQALERLVALPQYNAAERLYVTPDNSTEALRRRALDDGKTVVISTFGQRRGMVLLDPGKIPRERRELASTLDGMERCGVRLGLDDLAELGRLDVVVTGAFAVTEQGIHVDSHADYFDLEWGLLAELGLVVPATPVIAIVHAAQVIDVPLSPEPYEVTVDLIVTAERLVRCTRDLPRPVSIPWSDLDGRRVAASAYLSALNERRASASSASSQIAWNRAFEKGPLRA